MTTDTFEIGPDTIYHGHIVRADYDQVFDLQVLARHIRYMEETARNHWNQVNPEQKSAQGRYHQKASAHYYAGAMEARLAYISRSGGSDGM